MEIRCRNCGEHNPERARFCLQCGAALDDAAPVPAPRESRRVVTVVFADMVGFTTLGERLDQESLRRVMDSFYAEMRLAIEEESGTLAKFIGDAVLAVWGTPEVHEDDAPRAVRAAEGMRRRLDPLNAELERRWDVRIGLRTGVNTGEVVVDPTRPADLLVGDTLNVAARLEQAARDGEILLGPETWSLVRDVATLVPVEPLALKGKAEPMPAWRVIDGTLPDRRSAERLQAPLVGRTVELDRLRRAFAGAVAGRTCHVATVIGSPGMGKTRLVTELATAVADEATVLVGRCQDTGEGITLQPIAEVLRTAARIEDDDGPEAARDLLAGIVPAGEPDAERIVDRAGSVLGLSAPGPAEETFWAVRRVLEGLARERPVLLVLDDVHWGQPTFLELIEHLARWTRDAALLVVVLARPELRDLRPELTDPAAPGVADVVALEPLREDDSRALIDGLLGATDLPLELSTRILAATDGNPLFLGEVLRMLTDEGVLRRDGERWVATGEAEAVAVPPTIQALLAARIERLGDDERTVVGRAAVIGHEFYRGAVAELVPASVAPEVDTTLATLSRKELVRPESQLWLDERVYRFGHILVRDAAYRSLLKTARADLHERFASWLELKVGDLVGEHEDVIAFHLEQAHAHRLALGPLDDEGRALAARAGSRLCSAGDRALRREDLPAAANLLERALVPLAPATPERMEALVLLAEALLTAGETGRALAVIEELGEGARTLDDERLGAWATVFLAQLDALTGSASLGDVIEAATEAAVALERAGDRTGVGKAFQIVAVGEAQLGRVGAAEAALDRALAAARGIGDDRRETAVLAGAPRAALWGPAPILRAAGRCMDTIRILRMTPGRRHVEAMALRCQAVLEAMRGRGEAARGILADCRAVYEELGLVLELHETAVYAGMAELLLDDPAEAEVDLFGAREGFGALGADVPAALASALLAHALLAQDRVDEALDATRFAEAHAGEDLKATVTWLGARGEALARGGEHAAAREHAERAVALTEPTDALADKADAHMALARVAAAAGDEAAARTAAETARALYAAKGHTVGEARAAALLDASAPSGTAGATTSDPAVEERLRETPAGRLQLAFNAAYNARDWDAVSAYYHADVRTADHRRIPWEDIPNADAWVARMQAYATATPDSTMWVDRVVALAQNAAAIVIRGRGRTVDGGLAELVFGQVFQVHDGRTATLDFYEPDDDAGMLARFGELTEANEDVEARLHGSAMGRQLLAFNEAYNTRDWARVAELNHPELHAADHRTIATWEPVAGAAGWAETIEAFAAASPDSRLMVGRVVALSEDAAAVVLIGQGTSADGGDVELRFGQVSQLRDGATFALAFFEPDDDAGMLTRFEELRGDMRPELETSAIGRNYRAFIDGVNARDWDALAALYRPDAIGVDHRNLSWDLAPGPGPLVELLRSIVDAAPDSRMEIARVLAMDEELIALEIAGTGRTPDGGEVEVHVGHVATVTDGLRTRVEFFDPDDDAGMLARYEELRATRDVDDDLAATSIGRAYLRFSSAFGDKDFAALREVYAPDFLMRDGRSLGWEDTQGIEEMLEMLAGVFALAQEIRGGVGRILGLEDELAAIVLDVRGVTPDGGDTEMHFGQVSRARDGRLSVIEIFDPEDDAGMLARFEELRAPPIDASLEGTAIGAVYDRFVAAFGDRDWDAMVELHVGWFSLRDHRAVGWGTLHGAQPGVDVLRGFVELAPDAAIGVARVLAVADDRAALVLHASGTSTDGGPAELQVGHVTRVLDGRLVSIHVFEPDDEAGMLADFERLLADAAHPVFEAWPDATNARDWDAALALYAPTARFVDRRTLAWDEMVGGEAVMAALRTAVEIAEDMRIDIELLGSFPDGDDLAAACIHCYSGTTPDGGSYEIYAGLVFTLSGGLLDYGEFHEPEDRQALVARARELAEGPGGEAEARGLIHRWAEAVNDRDWERVVALYVPSARYVDRRSLAWEEMSGPEGIVAALQSAFDDTPSVVVEPEVFACIERAGDGWCLASIQTYRGTTPEGGPFEVAVGTAILTQGERFEYGEFLDPDDRDAIVARARELAKDSGSAGQRAIRAFERGFNERDEEGLRALFVADCTWIDRRTVGWADRDIEGVLADVRSAAEMVPDIQVAVEFLWEGTAADGRWVAATIERYRGTSSEGHEMEYALGTVITGRELLTLTSENMDADDRGAILARARELAGQ